MAPFPTLPSTLAVVGGLLLLGCEQLDDPPAPRVNPARPVLSLAPNEPNGFVVLTDWPMDSLRGDGWRLNSVECHAERVVQDETSPGTAPNVGEFHVYHSLDGAFCRTIFERSTTSTRALYLAFWLKLGTGWQGSTNLVNLYSFTPDPATAIGVDLRSGTDGQLTLALSVRDSGVDNSHLANSSTGGNIRYLGGNAGGRDYVITPGQWYRVELHIKQSGSPTSRDGILQWWANQTPIGDYGDVNFLATPYNHVVFGMGDVWNVAADTLREDDVRISVPSLGAPGAVADLRVSDVGTGGGLEATAVWKDSLRIGFSGVDDGTGQPASYEVRYASGAMDWESASLVPGGTCASARLQLTFCSVTGLSPSTTYSFQVRAYRGDPNHTPVTGPLSNVITVTTRPTNTSGVVGTVHDLSAVGAPGTSLYVQFTAVDDGTGDPAKYDVRYAVYPIGWGWGRATVVTHGGCSTPFRAAMIDARHFCTIQGLSPGTTYDVQVVAYRGTLDQDATFGGLSNVATATTPASSTASQPGTVNDLVVTGSTQTQATLSFTEVQDGAGTPAAYDVRYAATPLGWGWGSATVVTEGTCATPVTGRAVGAPRTCTVDGLSPGTSYDFQLVAYRGTLNWNATFGGLSNVATGATSP